MILWWSMHTQSCSQGSLHFARRLLLHQGHRNKILFKSVLSKSKYFIFPCCPEHLAFIQPNIQLHLLSVITSPQKTTLEAAWCIGGKAQTTAHLMQHTFPSGELQGASCISWLNIKGEVVQAGSLAHTKKWDKIVPDIHLPMESYTSMGNAIQQPTDLRPSILGSVPVWEQSDSFQGGFPEFLFKIFTQIIQNLVQQKFSNFQLFHGQIRINVEMSEFPPG